MNNELSQAEAAPELEYVTFKGAESPKVTFFYERVDKQNQIGYIDSPDNQAEVIAVGEQEAAGLKPHIWKQVGVSDGTAYASTILKCGLSKGTRVPIERAREVLKQAFDAELEAARGHFRTPHKQTYFFMGASQGTQGGDELARRIN